MKTLRPTRKMVIRFSVVMSILLGIGVFFIGHFPCLQTLVTVAITFCLCAIFAYSFRIEYSKERVKIFQYFIRVANIEISDIKNIYFQAWGKRKYQDNVLVIKYKPNKTKYFPVRFYGSRQVDKLIAEVKSQIAEGN